MAKAKGMNFDSPINIGAAGWALSVTLVVLYVTCLLAALAFPGVPLAHNWVTLFSIAPMTSGRAWVEGVLASIAFGWLIAVVLGLVYNRLVAR